MLSFRAVARNLVQDKAQISPREFILSDVEGLVEMTRTRKCGLATPRVS
jgi:hypothetical protein